MAIKIGHASVDERGKAAGGIAGDQTGKEVCVRSWYSGGWHTVLRPKSRAIAEKSAKACEAACANRNIGYDQSGRNSLYTAAKDVGFDLSKIKMPCACDCSSLMHVCIIAGGAHMAYGSNATTTGIMVREIMNTGDYQKLTDGKYLTSDQYLRRGDILVKQGHTAMVLENGAEANNVLDVYKPDIVTVYYSVRLPLLQRGMKSDAVKSMQQLLSARGYDLPTNGTFCEVTALALYQFQNDMALVADSKCGRDTWSALLGLTGVG